MSVEHTIHTHGPEYSTEHLSPEEMVEYYSVNPGGTLLPVETYRYVQGGRTKLVFVKKPERPVGEEMPPYQVVIEPKRTVIAMASLDASLVEIGEFTLIKKRPMSPGRLMKQRFFAYSEPDGGWRIEESAVDEDEEVEIDLGVAGTVKVISSADIKVDLERKHEDAISRMTPDQAQEFALPGEILFALGQHKIAKAKNTNS